MAENLSVKDGLGQDQSIRAKDIGGIKYPGHVLYDEAGNPVFISVYGTLTDRSGTITTGTTFQQVFAPSTSAKHRSVQNPLSATETLYVKINATIYELAPGGFIERNARDYMSTDAWQVMANTTGHAFIAGEG